MSATVKHLSSTNAAALILYLRGKPDRGLEHPRAVFESGQHCHISTAIEEFRELRLEHGRDGEVRRTSGSYERPDDPAEATHVKVGKNWREAKKRETATHVRLEPEVPLTKQPEAFHFIYSFDAAAVNPNDPQACLRAFKAVEAFRHEQTPGTQSLLVAHGDAKGSKAAIERGEGGKFHVHEAMNAVVYAEFELGGRTFRPGMRVSGAITHVDTYRAAWDEFLERRGREFGLEPQDVTVLPPVGSPEYRAVRRSDHDHFEHERGGISDQDRARRGIETALEQLSQDPARLTALDTGERVELLADTVAATGDVELKLRSAQGGTRVRSYVVPGRAQPIGNTRLGGRYTNDGLAEQLELVAQGRWTRQERGRVTQPPTTFAPLTLHDEQQLWDQVRQAAHREQQSQEIELQEQRRIEAAPERQLAQPATSRTEDADAPVGLEQIEQGDGDVADRQQAAAATTDAAAEPAPAQPETPPAPPRPRRERQVGVLSRDQVRDRELVAVIAGEHDGHTYIDVQLAAHDPSADRLPGLHLYAKTQKAIDDQGRRLVSVRTARPYTREQADALRTAAGNNRVVVDGREVLAVRGNVMPAVRGDGYVVHPTSARPTDHRIGEDVLDRQRDSEDKARKQEKAAPVADLFSDRHDRAAAKDRDWDLTG